MIKMCERRTQAVRASGLEYYKGEDPRDTLLEPRVVTYVHVGLVQVDESFRHVMHAKRWLLIAYICSNLRSRDG